MMNKDTRYPLISVRNGYKDGNMGKRDGFLLTKDDWNEEQQRKKIDKFHLSFKTQKQETSGKK